MSEWEETEGAESFAVAVIGMAGRFPGAGDIETFWRNLRAGVESIAFVPDEELARMGVDPALIRRPDFVGAAPLLDGIDAFDAPFFGYAPAEARLLDPQQRVFLETAWAAMEHAGYDLTGSAGAVGVYAGTSISSYLLFNLLTRPEIAAAEDSFPFMVSNDKDFLATRVSYHLNLKGPSVDVQTGCSTSLVAVHMACQALLSYQCDTALAGGVSVHMPQRAGYIHEPGGITSPDGHCRAFDARAQGTVFGSGVGVVVLKRLEDALADGDTIYAVVKGSAVNNDGAAKVGYTAPSVEGQAEVIARAQALAEVAPDSIGYVETHGTGTLLGDPVEITALTQAFRLGTDRNQFCAVGSVKTNIGHLDAAAGVAGLIKTVLALRHGEIPPSLHFEQPNPNIDFAGSPFYVSGELRPWPRGAGPRRAGVSSFGIGGTNAHVVLEEAPAPAPTSAGRPHELLVLSAQTPAALEARIADLAAHLQRHPELPLADVAYTLQAGRKAFEQRAALVCRDTADAAQALAARDPQRLQTGSAGTAAPPVVLMFPGGGAQHLHMAAGLYQSEPVFRAHIDTCCDMLRGQLGFDLREAIYPAPEREAAAQQRMKQTSVGLPALFVIEYSLAQLWMAWGLRPEALIGHSMGEYVAACLAGVFSLEDALALVVVRGRLFERVPQGAMLSVGLPEAEARALLDEQLSLAAINGAGQCVIAGALPAIERLAATLEEQELDYRRLQIDVAAHSHLVSPILEPFLDFISRLRLSPPQIPFVSNVTGTWITAEQATDPRYWVRHLRETVRFADGLAALAEQSLTLLLEVGPGRALTTLARLQAGRSAATTALASLRHPQDRVTDLEHLLATAGRLWLAGVRLDWAALRERERRRRLPLPSYPFERQRHWMAPEPQGRARPRSARRQEDIASWFYLPSWQRAPLAPRRTGAAALPQGWLLLMDAGGLGARLAERLERAGCRAVRALPGARFGRAAEGFYTLNPRRRDDYAALLAELAAQGQPVDAVLHLWSLDDAADAPDERGRFRSAQERGLYSLLALAQALAEQDAGEARQIWVVSGQAQAVESADAPAPEHAPLLAACSVIPQEYERLDCHSVDIGPAQDARQLDRAAGQIFDELAARPAARSVAYRGPHRWLPGFQPVRLEPDAEPARGLREGGVYMITGGLGGIGLLLAEHLARTCRARLVLVGRSALPPRASWPGLLLQLDGGDPLGRRLRALQALERQTEVLVLSADVADEAALRAAVEQTCARFGALHGVIHAAGLAGEQTISLIPDVDPADCERQFQAKVYGTYALRRALQGRDLDFCLLFSSNAAVLGGVGLLAYSAANAFLDAFAAAQSGREPGAWISASWDGWLLEDDPGQRTFQTSIDQFALRPGESTEALTRIVTSLPGGPVAVSSGDLEARAAQWLTRAGRAGGGQTDGPAAHARPELGSAYIPPGTDMERTIAAVWQDLLGIERVGIHDNFFDLGGSSLIGLKVVARLKQELRIDIPVVALFEGPTVSRLAEVLLQRQADAPGYDEEVSRGERRRARRARGAHADELFQTKDEGRTTNVSN
jgi:acyl transferase domain-containing protein